MAADLGHDTATESDRIKRAFSVLRTHVVDIVGVRLDAPAEVSAALWQLLSRTERERAEKFRFAEHREHYIVARASLRRLLAERLHIAPRAVELVETKYGKPRLAPVHRSANVEFNLSHSGILALYAFTSGRAVGVDVELIREVPDADDLAERFFCPPEARALRALAPEARREAFFHVWTRKEAYIKATGDGLSTPLSDFRVTLKPAEPARFVYFGRGSSGNCGWMLRNLEIAPEYAAAVAWRHGFRRIVQSAVLSAPQLLQRCG